MSDLPKAEQVLEGVLDEQPGDDAHGGGQAGSTHPFPLEGALVYARRHN